MLKINADETKKPLSLINDKAPIIPLINSIILNAIQNNVSDIHFEPYENDYRVRYRQDGYLHEVAKPTTNLIEQMASRLKVMANLDISEKRLPQDGRFSLNFAETGAINFRINTCPTLFGEKIVLRILDASIANTGIDQLGFEPQQRIIFETAIHKPQGMILVTGPTGSGKTVTLYTALTLLNKPNYNISTIEDPVEIYLNGINQVNVNPKIGLNFSTALRAFLRQDPDIIMVGEIRDTETAEISIKAAQTGHLVLSTLHTNSAAATLVRLLNMGIAAFNVINSISLIIAQRLIRRLCDHCKTPVSIKSELILKNDSEQQLLKNCTIYQAQGCHHCNHGYKGRIGIYEVMPMSDTIKNIIMSGGNIADIITQAQQEGMLDLRQGGLLKVAQGLSSLAEINRVLVE